jgi:integrase/recombinase XerD
MLGHESTTTEIYLHLDENFLTEVINTFHPGKVLSNQFGLYNFEV